MRHPGEVRGPDQRRARRRDRRCRCSASAVRDAAAAAAAGRAARAVAQRGAQLLTALGRRQLGQRMQRGVRVGGAAERGDHRRRGVVGRRRRAPRPTSAAVPTRAARRPARRRRRTAGPAGPHCVAASPPRSSVHGLVGGPQPRASAAGPGRRSASAASAARIAAGSVTARASRSATARGGATDVGSRRTLGEGRGERLPDLGDVVVRGDRALERSRRGRSRRGCIASRRPLADHVRRGLDVELDAPGQPAEPEGLLLAARRAGQLDRAGRQPVTRRSATG